MRERLHFSAMPGTPPPRSPVRPLDRVGESVLHAEPIEAALHPREWSGPDAGETQLFLIQSRRGALLGAGDRVELAAPALAWVPGGFGRTMRLEAGARGYRLSVSDDLLAGAISGLPGAGTVRRLLGRAATVAPARLAPFAEEVALCVRALAREIREPLEGSSAMQAAHLALLCLHVWRLSGAGASGQASRAAAERPASVAQRFLQLVELHLRDGWSVKRYADALGVTEDRLHAAAIRSHGRPPGALIRERLVAEVCARLKSSDLPAEQIAFALGFRDPGYFSRFCSKHLGMPPGRYRREAKASRPRTAPGSYAAWP